MLYLANLLSNYDLSTLACSIDCNYIENTLIFSRNVISFECCDFNLERNEDIDYRTRLILLVSTY